ncbi:MAG: G5 domain-containing protein [Bowdeniella nasicola]|nr:G5 domain-containing protein [Bowdeniella nasicola]
MTRQPSGRHAATPSLAARFADRLHEPRLRTRLLAAGAALALASAGIGAYPLTGTGEEITLDAAPALADGGVETSRDLARLALDDVERVEITVNADGERIEVSVPALTVAEALAEAGIVVGAFDHVSVPLSDMVEEGMEITIERGDSGVLSEETVTTFETIEKDDPTLPKGTTKISSQGQEGIERTTYRVQTHAGEEIERTALATVTVQEKQDRVVLVGTKEVRRATVHASSGQSAPAPAAPVASGSPRDIARSMLSSYGWGQDQFSCLNSLWERESHWNPRAHNRGSGAYGIPQALPGSKMASAGADWRTNPATQIRWGLGYIKGRYGSPCGALNHSHARGWY